MTLLSIKGEPLQTEHRPETTPDTLEVVAQPKNHEPRWFRRVREQANQRFRQIYEDFLKDVNAEGTPGTITDRDAIKRSYGHMWAAYAHHILNSSEPIGVDPDAMHKQIQESYDQSDARARREYLFNTPVNRLTKEDIESLDFVLFDEDGTGATWLCTNCLLAVQPQGQCRLWLRGGSVTVEDWFRTVNMVLRHPADLHTVQYSLSELGLVMKGLRMEPFCKPTEAQLENAKEGSI